MPIILLIVFIAATVGVILYRMGHVTTASIMMTAGALIGAGLGVFVMRSVAPGFGVAGLAAGGLAGAVLLLWLLRMGGAGRD